MSSAMQWHDMLSAWAGAQEFKGQFNDAVAKNTELLGEELHGTNSKTASKESTAEATTEVPSAADELASKTEKLKVDSEETKTWGFKFD